MTVLRLRTAAPLLAVAVLTSACQPDAAPTAGPDPVVSSGRHGNGHPRCTDKKVPHRRRAVRALAFPRGRGPVYVGLGTGGSVHYEEDAREHGGWFYNKVLIAVSPDYRFGVSINGRRRDGRDHLRWHNGPFPGKSSLVLELPPDEEKRGWSYWAGDMLIRSPGCYVIRIVGESEGTHFVEEIPFRAAP